MDEITDSEKIKLFIERWNEIMKRPLKDPPPLQMSKKNLEIYREMFKKPRKKGK
jgi:hypothetical protein